MAAKFIPQAVVEPGRSSRAAVVRPLAPGRYRLQITVSAETHAKLRRARDLLRHAIPNGDEALIVDRALTVLLEQLEKKKFAATKSEPAPGRATATAADGNACRGSRRGSTGPADGRSEQRAIVFTQPGAADGPAPRRHAVDAASANGTAASSSVDASRSRRLPAAVRRQVWARSGGQCEFVADDGRRCEERGFLEFHHRVPFAAGGVSSVTNVLIHCRSHNQHEADAFFGSRATRVGGRRSGQVSGTNVLAATRTVVSPSPATVDSCRDPGESGGVATG